MNIIEYAWQLMHVFDVLVRLLRRRAERQYIAFAVLTNTMKSSAEPW